MFDWIFHLHEHHQVAHAVGALAAVCVLGMALGSLKVRGIGLGTSAVLFAGILFGHFGEPVDHATLDFVKEFGLIIFVFSIGLQLGPGFFAALKEQGLRLNGMAVVIVVLGAVLACLSAWLIGFDTAGVPGVFAGATTNTPSLGAATQTMSGMEGMTQDRLALPALAYAVTYPMAIIGIIGSLTLLKRVFKIDATAEAAAYAKQHHRRSEKLKRRTLLVTNPNLEGVRVADIPGRIESKITIGRIKHGDQMLPGTEHTVIHVGDLIAVIGSRDGIESFRRVVGEHSAEDLEAVEAGGLTFRRVVVTDRAALGKSIAEIDLDGRFDVAVTRVTRADIEMTAVPGLKLQFGDMMQIVGSKDALDQAAAAVGNSLKALNEMHFIPFFIGILLGIIVGTMPIAFPGIPQPVSLGLAGGPLIVALILGRVGRIGRQVWHMPTSTNLAFREFGISLFFAAVGLKAGAQFFATVFSATGAQWLLAGILVTMLPLLLVGVFARVVWKTNFMDLSGTLAGSMTDPPALAFACNVAGSDAPNVAYATVYPLTTLMRILSAQLIVVILLS